MSVIVRYSDELYHYGIKGQKWGIRRYQNEDGSLTPEGRKRYGSSDSKTMRKDIRREYKKENQKARYLMDEASRYAGGLNKATRIRDSRAKALSKSDTEDNRIKLKAAESTRQIFEDKVKESDKAAVDHYNELVSKYGADAVKPIKRDKNGRIVGSKANYAKRVGVSTAADLAWDAVDAVITTAINGLTGMDLPYMWRFTTPLTQRDIGSNQAKRTYKNAYDKLKYS